MRNNIRVCLDEIEAAYCTINGSKSSKERISQCKSWVRNQKLILKELKYKGKIPRQPKTRLA